MWPGVDEVALGATQSCEQQMFMLDVRMIISVGAVQDTNGFIFYFANVLAPQPELLLGLLTWLNAALDCPHVTDLRLESRRRLRL